MYKELFESSLKHLKKLGFAIEEQRRSSVSKTDLKDIENRIDFPMPDGLREYFLLMGDGYYFSAKKNDLIVTSWEQIYLNDYAVSNKGFWQQVDEDANGYVPDEIDDELLRQESERRKKWRPFYGFIGSEGRFCFDERDRVRLYETMEWPHFPESWDFVVADSFQDFVSRWSEFCFVSKVELIAFCEGKTGRFNWDVKNFPMVEGTFRGNL